MRISPGLQQFFQNRMRRAGEAAFGLFIFSFGYYLQLTTSIGVSPWHSLNQGVSKALDITFGQASILISLFVIAADLLLREPIGLGTILDAFVVGLGSDFFLWLNLIPYQDGFWSSVLILVTSMVVSSLGSWIYMSAGLSCGPRDALMVAIGKRLSHLSIGGVNILICVAVAAVGYALGGVIGPGTWLNMFGIGLVMDGVFKILRFDPRNVEQEGLAQMCRTLASIWKSNSL